MSKKRLKFPLYETAGSVSIPIYRVKHKTAKAGFVYTIAWQGLAGGRKTRQFASLTEAKQEAYDKAVAIAKGLADTESHERHDLVELSMARKLAGDTPNPQTAGKKKPVYTTLHDRARLLRTDEK
jgi:hypothetical protein